MLLKIKIKLLELLINSIFKYNEEDCPDKFIESAVDDLTSLIKL
jgi:hypothetical protein